MSELKVGDKVRVVYKYNNYYNKVGTIVGKSNSLFEWIVVFEDGCGEPYNNEDLELVENKPEFKVGDLIECLNPRLPYLHFGGIYTVTSVPSIPTGTGLINIQNDKGCCYSYPASEFKLYKPKTKLKTTSELSLKLNYKD